MAKGFIFNNFWPKVFYIKFFSLTDAQQEGASSKEKSANIKALDNLNYSCKYGYHFIIFNIYTLWIEYKHTVSRQEFYLYIINSCY